MSLRGLCLRTLLGCAIALAMVVAAPLVDAQERWPSGGPEPPRGLGTIDVSPDKPFDESIDELAPADGGNWLPQWTLPHPDLAEQLWRPGDLVDDTYFLRRPWHAGFLVGTMDGDRLTNSVDQSTDWFDGLRIGNDFAPQWGWELRSAFFSPELAYTTGQQGFARDWFVDLNVLHYPWGDTRIRPFWSIGLGGGQLKFVDENARDIRDWVADLPLSVGCKYHWKPWLVLRGELTDTIVFGNENFDTLNNLSLSVGAEIHWHSFKTLPVKYGY